MVDKCLHLGYNIYVEYKGALYAPMENIITMPTWGQFKSTMERRVSECLKTKRLF